MSFTRALAPREPRAERADQATAVLELLAVGLSSAGLCWGLRVLAGRPDQVRVARQVVRQHLADHPAAVDAVVVASELAANSVTHSASRLDSGRFLIRAAALDGCHAVVAVTDQGGPFAPQTTDPDGESGRGLTVVRSLACLFDICDHDGYRTFAAVIAAGPDTASGASPCQPFAAETARSAGRAP